MSPRMFNHITQHHQKHTTHPHILVKRMYKPTHTHKRSDVSKSCVHPLSLSLFLWSFSVSVSLWLPKPSLDSFQVAPPVLWFFVVYYVIAWSTETHAPSSSLLIPLPAIGTKCNRTLIMAISCLRWRTERASGVRTYVFYFSCTICHIPVNVNFCC